MTLHMLMQMAASHTFRTAEAAIFAIHPSMPLHKGAPMQHPKQQPMWRLKVAVLKDLLRHRLTAHTAMATPEGSRRPPKVAQGHLQTLLPTGPRLLISMGSINAPMRPSSALCSCPLPLLALVSCGQRQTMSMGSVLPPLDPLPRLGCPPQGPLLAAQVSGVRLSISESARAAAEDAKAQAEAGKAAAEIASVTAEASRARPRSRCAGWNRPGLQLRQLKQRQRTAGVRLKRHAAGLRQCLDGKEQARWQAEGARKQEAANVSELKRSVDSLKQALQQAVADAQAQAQEAAHHKAATATALSRSQQLENTSVRCSQQLHARLCCLCFGPFNREVHIAHMLCQDLQRGSCKGKLYLPLYSPYVPLLCACMVDDTDLVSAPP